MGKEEKGHETREAFTGARRRFVAEAGPATLRAEQRVKETGTLNPLVDPAGYGVIRRSLPRFVQKKNKLWQLAVGVPVPIETRVDTTGSMGDNVDIAIRVLPTAFELCVKMLAECDPQVATGFFGDVQDAIVLCRPQFEMDADKLVEQLTLMVPIRDGGDTDEDPHYGLFGAAYLTAAYIDRIGLKGYDFTISDAPAHDRLDERQLRRIFGMEVFEKVNENGHALNLRDLPSNQEIVQDLLKRAHAFFLQVGDSGATTAYWTRLFGRQRVIVLPRTELAPQVQATIIGLTEGTLALADVKNFLRENNVGGEEAKMIVRSVANIPIGAQAALPNFQKRPKKGDLYREKTDAWPIPPEEAVQVKPEGEKPDKSTWL